MPSIIKAISLKNFKGFSDEVRIDLRPITLLFGANSAGKSSVLHALQYVREILERNNANADRTLQGGDAVDLGGFQNLVHGRDRERCIEIEIEMALGADSIPEIVPEAFEDWQTNDDDVFKFYEALQTIRRKVSTVSIRLVIGWNSYAEMPVVVGYEIGTNGVWCVKLAAPGGSRDTTMKINRVNPIFMVEAPDDENLFAELDDWVSPNDLGDADLQSEIGGTEATPIQGLPSDLVANINEIGAKSEELLRQLKQKLDESNSIQVRSSEPQMVSVLNEIFYSVQEAGMERPGDGLRSWLNGFNGALPRLDQMLFIPAPGAKGAANVYIAREFTAFLSWLCIGPAILLREQLRQLRYLGPLRRIPPRGLEASRSKTESGWSDGMAAWETLLTGPQDLVNKCSNWMASGEKLKTGYYLLRRQIQNFDLNQPVPQPIDSPRNRIDLVDSEGNFLQPPDVGVGISQVLPVVVAAQDGNASVVCIEQPELHIHPSVQVGLGDLFIDGALNNGLSFLIETHSEHLIMRLQRRIRETTREELTNDQTPVAAKDVNVIYVGRDEAGVVVATNIALDDDGKFLDRWPAGFFPERMREALPKEVRDKIRAAGAAER